MKDSHIESKKRLEHIMEAIETIERHVQNETLQSFCQNELLNNAVLFQFTVIGEAIISIDEKKLSQYNYPWYKVRSFRNLIAHEYFNIKLPAVWKILEDDLPKLKAVIKTILQKEF